MSKKIDILLPDGFMNCGTTGNNWLYADTNDSVGFQSIKFPLPKPEGRWRIHSYKNDNTTVTLIDA